MASPADFNLSQGEGGRTALITGDWTAVLMGEANERLESAIGGASDVTLEFEQQLTEELGGLAARAITRV